MICPVCSAARFHVWAPAQHLRREIALREDFVSARLHRPRPEELKDLTDFMHGSAVALFACSRCGLVRRGEAEPEDESSYAADANDRDLMRHLLPRYVEAFRRKMDAYRPLLPRGSRVLEVGSHLGAFLQVASEWDWRPEALEVGPDTAYFQRESGFRVHRTVIEDAPFSDSTFDAVFIWNCFEQLPDPRGAMAAARRLLRRHGWLVLRVPNALFYRVRRHPQALAYNNLLGFPYLHGYTAATLNRLLAGCGFEPLQAFNSELITMPFADPDRRVRREERSVSRREERWSQRMSARLDTLAGPWIEVVYRKSSHPAPGEVKPGPIFLKRAA
jgi:SAM-dependent methyltransferase